MNNSSILTTTFCRSCKRLRSCLDTKKISNYSFLCKECARNQDLVIECINCGREATKDILKHGGYCHLCERDNIIECDLCGSEIYKSNSIDGICKKCATGENKECIKCGREVFVNDTKDGLCIYCYSQELEEQIKKLKFKRKYYKY